MSSNDWVELAFDKILHDKHYSQAILFDFGEDEPVWIPKSQINMAEFDKTSNTVEIREWIAIEKGLI